MLKAMAWSCVHTSEALERMSDDPITVSVDTGLEEAARIMLENGFRHLPVVDELGQVVGIASLRRVAGATQAAAKPA